MTQAYHEERELTPDERAELRAYLMNHNANNAIRFQAEAVKKYGAAGGIMCRELLFWDGKQWDPDGWIYQTKEEFEGKTGLSPKSQDGARKRLEDAGVLEVQRRPRRSQERKITHPSPVLHYRLKLRELFEQMTPDGVTLNHESNDADRDTRESGLGDSSTPKGAFEYAVTGPPYTEVTPEETSEGTSRGFDLQSTRASARTETNISKKEIQENKGSEKTPKPRRQDHRGSPAQKVSKGRDAGLPSTSTSKPDPPELLLGEKPRVWQMIWSEPADAVLAGRPPSMVAGQLALACARGEDVTLERVAEAVREAFLDKYPVETYMETVRRGVDELRKELPSNSSPEKEEVVS